MGAVVPFGATPAYPVLIAEFSRRYNNAKTRHQYVQELTARFEATRRDHPRLLTESDVFEWCGQAAANNTIRNRHSRICVFLRWCVRTGEADPALLEAIAGRDNPLRKFRALTARLRPRTPLVDPRRGLR